MNQPVDVNVGPPSIDIFPLLTKIMHWIVAVYPDVFNFFKHLVGILVGFSFPISLALLIGIIYCVQQLKAIRSKEEQIFDLKVEPAYEPLTGEGETKQPQGDDTLAKRWDAVGKHIESDNPNDWKQAILESDVMLDEILTKLGYRGESVGEKLKRAEPADFETLQDAWEAHKIRNRIAHDGSAFDLNHHEAKKTVALYRKVFEEFYYM